MMARSLFASLLLLLLTSVCSASTVTVLMFHKINDAEPPARENIHRAQFSRLLDLIEARGYKTLTVSELAAAVTARRVPERAVVLTFDDGWKTVEHAAAELVKRNMKGTFYIISGMLKAPYLSPEAVVRLSKNPLFEIGAHSHTHFMEWENDLDKLDTRVMLGEMVLSKVVLERLIGKPITSYALPFGLFREEMIPAAEALGFTSLAHVDGKSRVGALSDPLRLKRINVDGRCPLAAIEEMISTGDLNTCVNK